jgi:hypothetical protein
LIFILAQRSPALSQNSPRPRRPPPPIPSALRCLSRQQSNNFSTIPPNGNFQYSDPPGYNDVMRNSTRATNSLPNLVDDVNEQNEWSCSMCTFLNYPLLNQCEQCDMPRVHQGIKNITNSSIRPFNFENNQLQGSIYSSDNNL